MARSSVQARIHFSLLLLASYILLLSSPHLRRKSINNTIIIKSTRVLRRVSPPPPPPPKTPFSPRTFVECSAVLSAVPPHLAWRHGPKTMPRCEITVSTIGQKFCIRQTSKCVPWPTARTACCVRPFHSSLGRPTHQAGGEIQNGCSHQSSARVSLYKLTQYVLLLCALIKAKPCGHH